MTTNEKLFFNIAFVFALICVFNYAEAANWVSVGTDTLDNEYYINTNTIVTTKESQFKVLYNEKLSSLGKQDFQSRWSDEYTNTEYVCYEMEWLEFIVKNGNVEVKVFSRSIYDSQGEFMGNIDRPYAFHKVGLNSMYMIIYRKSRAYL